MISAWSRWAMARSGSGIVAIAASTSLSPSALVLFARASAFSSLARSFIAARSSAVNPLVLFADFFVAFFPVLVFAMVFSDLLWTYGAQPLARRHGTDPRLDLSAAAGKRPR